MTAKIPMTNGGSTNPLELANDLERMLEWLEERAEQIYTCNCEDDSENIKGSYEYDTGAYNHGDNCPTWQEGHQQIIIKSAANFFKALESQK